jgi:uncharacterized membrane protein
MTIFMKKISLFLLMCIFICACNNTPKKTADSVPKVDTKTAPNDTVRTYIGLISHGSAGSFFRPCGRDSTRWAIVDSTGKMIETYKKVYQYGYDNQSVMAFVEGSLLGPNTEGVTDNTLKISKIQKMEQKDWDGYCMGFEFVIFDDKPFWAVEISPKEQYIDFNDEANLRYHHFRYVKPIIEGEKRTYETFSFDGKETLKVVITKGDCKDESNPKPYPFSAQVVLNGKIYNGCAQW